MQHVKKPARSSAGVAGFVGMLGGSEALAEAFRTIDGVQRLSPEHGRCTLAYYQRNAPCERATPETRAVFTGRPFLNGSLLGSAEPDPHETLDGKFAMASLGPHSVALSTDCLGAGAVYYTEANGAFYFASHLGLLLKMLPVVPKSNEFAIAAQLFARAQIFDETHFEGVFRLPAGTSVTAELDPSDATLKVGKPRGGGMSALLAAEAPAFGPGTLMSLLDKGVAREAFGPDSLLMLSGGRDSLAIALADAPTPPRAATYGERYSMDFVRGRRRARQLGLKSSAVPYDDWRIDSYHEEIVGLHAGCSGLQTAHNIVAFDWAQDADVAAVGFLGDALTGAHLGPSADPDEGQALKVLLPNLDDPLLSDSFPEEKAAVKEFVLSRFRELSQDVGGRRALMLLDLEWRQARWISMMFDLCEWFVPVAYPFFQRDLIASSLQADQKALRNQQAYDKALRHGLSRRNLSLSMHSLYSPRREAWLRALMRRKRPTSRVDWASVVRRTGALPRDYFCGHDKLDAVTARSWQNASSGPAAKIPIACATAAIAAALKRFGH